MSKKSKDFSGEVVRLRVSTPILSRVRCNKCGKLPSIYYSIYLGLAGRNPRRKIAMSYHSFRMGGKILPRDKPKSLVYMSDLSQSTKYKSWNPKWHHFRGDAPLAEYDLDLVEYITCKCGKSSWAFSELGIQHRPEILNKKARSYYPVTYKLELY
jgi:hypothetical protein